MRSLLESFGLFLWTLGLYFMVGLLSLFTVREREPIAKAVLDSINEEKLKPLTWAEQTTLRLKVFEWLETHDIPLRWGHAQVVAGTIEALDAMRRLR